MRTTNSFRIYFVQYEKQPVSKYYINIQKFRSLAVHCGSLDSNYSRFAFSSATADSWMSSYINLWYFFLFGRTYNANKSTTVAVKVNSPTADTSFSNKDGKEKQPVETRKNKQTNKQTNNNNKNMVLNNHFSPKTCAVKMQLRKGDVIGPNQVGLIRTKTYFVLFHELTIHETKTKYVLVRIRPLLENGAPQRQAVGTFDVCLAQAKVCPTDIVRSHAAQLMIDKSFKKFCKIWPNVDWPLDSANFN